MSIFSVFSLEMYTLTTFAAESILLKRREGKRGGLVVNASDSGSRGRGFESHSGQTVLREQGTFTPLISTGNTQEAVAPSEHD